MDLSRVVRARRMTREFLSEPVDQVVLDRCVDIATRAPSAGKSQGWSLVLLTGSETGRYWDIALPPEKRASFGFPGLLRAPVVAIVCADPSAYLARYSEPDKAATGLGTRSEVWPAPYWTIDASFATMTLLLALEDEGLGALFFAHAAEPEVRREFAIPDEVQILGMLAIGHRDPGSSRPGRSAGRPRRAASDVIRRGAW